eukprot:CAMPEP_0117821680 /NCGR_PEP_ID=MMETSP0949-20121206/3207_1 /TAXON_ID=44440 /ORGANISM="Chattonella subsalsa, Strain CCMP2191" /LENGTH=1841 /DNA_ID=CAMNT_0005660871 /DNA_START=134 /DNA_END=5659 /DNA_ORIENTATION=-
MALLKQAKSSLMKNKDEALLTACSKKKGLKEASDLILNHGADINFRNDELQTPLHLAAMHGNSNITKLLIRQNANVDAKDVHYRTPLHFAARNGQLTDIKLLVRGNAALHRDMLQKYPGESFEPHVSEFLRKRTIQLIEKSYHGVKLQYNEIETNPGGIPQAETAPGPLDSMPEEVDNFGRGGLLPRAFSRSGREVSTSSDNLVQRLFRNHNKSKSTSGKEAFGGKKKGIMIAQFADESDRSSEASINEIEKAIIIQSACRCYLARCRAVKKWVEQSTFHEYLGNESKEDTDKIMLKQMPTHLSQFNHARERSHKLGHEMETNRKLLEWVETGLSDIQKMEQSMGQSLLMGSVSAEDAKENEVSQNIENAKDMLVALKSRAMAQFLRDTASDKPATEQKRSRSHTRNSSMESFDSGFGDTGLLNTDVKSFLLAQSHRKLDADISLESQMEQALAKLASAQAKFDEAQRLEKELEKRRKQAIEDLQRYTANIRNLKQSAKNIALEDGLESIILLLHDAEEEIIKLRTKVKDAKSVIEVQEIVEAGSKIIYESTSSVSKSMVQKVYESDEEDSTLQKKMLETRETLKAMSGKIKQLRVFATEANIGGSLQAMAKIVTTIRKASEGLNELDSKIEDCISNEELESILNKGKSLLERATTNVHFWVKKATSSESDEIRNLDIAEEDEESRTRLRSRSTRSRSMTRSTSVVAEEARLHRKSSFSSISAKREGIMQAYFRRKSKSQDQPRLTRRKSDSQVKAGFLKSYFNKKSKSQNGSTFLKYGEEQEPISRPISRSTSLHLPTAAKTDFIQETQLQESSDNKSLNHHKVENSKEGQPRRARMKKPDDLANSSILKAFFRFSTDKSIKERLADARSEGTSVVLADSQLKDESVSADTAQESNLSAPSQAANVPLSTNYLSKESSKKLPNIAPIYTVHDKDDRGGEKEKAISRTAEELQVSALEPLSHSIDDNDTIMQTSYETENSHTTVEASVFRAAPEIKDPEANDNGKSNASFPSIEKLAETFHHSLENDSTEVVVGQPPLSNKPCSIQTTSGEEHHSQNTTNQSGEIVPTVLLEELPSSHGISDHLLESEQSDLLGEGITISAAIESVDKPVKSLVTSVDNLTVPHAIAHTDLEECAQSNIFDRIEASEDMANPLNLVSTVLSEEKPTLHGVSDNLLGSEQPDLLQEDITSSALPDPIQTEVDSKATTLNNISLSQTDTTEPTGLLEFNQLKVEYLNETLSPTGTVAVDLTEENELLSNEQNLLETKSAHEQNGPKQVTKHSISQDFFSIDSASNSAEYAEPSEQALLSDSLQITLDPVMPDSSKDTIQQDRGSSGLPMPSYSGVLMSTEVPLTSHQVQNSDVQSMLMDNVTENSVLGEQPQDTDDLPMLLDEVVPDFTEDPFTVHQAEDLISDNLPMLLDPVMEDEDSLTDNEQNTVTMQTIDDVTDDYLDAVSKQETNNSEPDAAAFWQDAGMQPNQTHLACHSVSRIKILWNRLDHCLLQSENMKDMGRAGKVQAKVSDLKSDLRDMLSGVLSDKKLMRLGSSTMKLEKQIQNEMRLERPLKKHAHDRRQPAFEESPVSVLEASASRSAAEDDELFEGYDQQQSSQLKYFVLPSSSIEHAATFSKASPPLGEVAVQSPNYHAKTKTEEQKAKDFKRLLKITALLATALLAFAVAYGFGSSTVEPPLQGVKVSQRIKQFGENTKLFLQKQTESAAQAAQEMVHMHKEITSHTSAAFQKQTEKVSQNAQDLVKMQKEKAAKAATKIQKHSEKAAQKAQEKASKAASKIQQHTEKASQNTQEMIKKHKDKVAEVGSTIVQKHNEKMEKIQIDASSFEKYHFIH